jgi:hypothetical protein
LSHASIVAEVAWRERSRAVDIVDITTDPLVITNIRSGRTASIRSSSRSGGG